VHILEGHHVDQLIAFAHNALPEADHLHVMLLEESHRYVIEALVDVRHSSRHDVIDPQLIDHGNPLLITGMLLSMTSLSTTCCASQRTPFAAILSPFNETIQIAAGIALGDQHR